MNIHKSYSVLTIKQSLVIDSHPHDATDEPKVLQMMLVAEARVRVDLKCVVVPREAKKGERRDQEGGNEVGKESK